MFGCVMNPGTSPPWPRALDAESSGAILYNEALKRTVYMADLFYPAVIPLASSLPPSQAPGPPGHPQSPSPAPLKFGIDRILGSSPKQSKDDGSKTKKPPKSPERPTGRSPASPRRSGTASPTSRRSPMTVKGEGHLVKEGHLVREGPGGLQVDIGRGKLPQDFLHELSFHQPIRPAVLHSGRDLVHPQGPLGHPPQDLRSRPEFLGAQEMVSRELAGRAFAAYPCPGASPPSGGLLPYHPSLHPVHLTGLHYPPAAHRHEYEGNYIMTSDLSSQRSHHGGHHTHHVTSSPTSQPKRKRSWSRAVFSHLQRKGLEKRFEVQKYVTKPDRKQLAAMLGLTDAQVKVWFQNRRMKWRHAEEAKRKKDETDDVTTDQTSSGDVTVASSSVDASHDSDEDELCIDDIDDDSSGEIDDVAMTSQSSAPVS